MPKVKLTYDQLLKLEGVLITGGELSPTDRNKLLKRLIAAKKPVEIPTSVKETKPAKKADKKPLTKKDMKKEVLGLLPSGKVTDRAEFLGGIRDRINAELPK